MKNKISFCYQVKEELSRNEYSKERLISVLSAFIKNNGSYHINGKNHYILLKSKNPKIIKFLYESVFKNFGVKSKIEIKKNHHKGTKSNYSLLIEQKVDDILDVLKIDFLENKLPVVLLENNEMVSGYFIGAFLACGSVNSPTTSNYHLEFFFRNENYSMWFYKSLMKCYRGAFTPKMCQRRDGFIVYLKQSQQIADLLIFMGAVESTMNFEQERLDRDFKNIGNRLDNCDKYNFRKAIKSGRKQIKQINYFRSNKKMDVLFTEMERKGLELRLRNEDYSYDELKDSFNDLYTNNVSKSWFNHLFRKLNNYYENRKKI